MVGKCHMCEKPIGNDDKYYEQQLVENEKTIPVITCEVCMDEQHACPQCGLSIPYCNDCV